MICLSRRNISPNRAGPNLMNGLMNLEGYSFILWESRYQQIIDIVQHRGANEQGIQALTLSTDITPAACSTADTTRSRCFLSKTSTIRSRLTINCETFLQRLL